MKYKEELDFQYNRFWTFTLLVLTVSSIFAMLSLYPKEFYILPFYFSIIFVIVFIIFLVNFKKNYKDLRKKLN